MSRPEEPMFPLKVTILAVRPAKTGENYLGINPLYGVADVTTWLAERETPSPVLIVAEPTELDESYLLGQRVVLEELRKAFEKLRSERGERMTVMEALGALRAVEEVVSSSLKA